MKKCSTCKELISLNNFFKCKKSSDGLRSQCKTCEKEYYLKHKKTILEYKQKHYHENRDSYRKNALLWRSKNVDSKRQMDHLHYLKNVEKIKEQARKYRKDHCENKRSMDKQYYNKIKNTQEFKNKRKHYFAKNREKINAYIANKSQTDIQFRLKLNLRRRISNMIRNKVKTGSAVRDLGCSVEYLITHLESKFQSGMTWDNYGLYGWHVDHIQALSNFDLTDRDQFLKACHYTNLQPLWAIDNIKKSNK